LPQTRSLLGKLSGRHIQTLLDIEARPEYRQDEPAPEVKMTRRMTMQTPMKRRNLMLAERPRRMRSR